MKKLLASAALAGALTLTGAGAASALEYPATPAQCGVSSGTTTPGGAVTFSCTGMTPDETVDVTVTCDTDDAAGTGGNGAAASAGTPVTTTGTAVAGADGSFTYSAVMNTAGLCTFTGVGSGSGTVVTAQVTVASQVTTQAAATSTGSGLANTGVDSSTAIWGVAGVGALALGTASVFLARRRSSSDAA